MRLIFIHGMRQEGKVPAELRQFWEDALTGAWRKAGLAPPRYTVEMPFYGDELNRLTEEVRGGATAVVARGAGGPGEFGPVETALLREMAGAQGVSDADIQRELGTEIVARGPANWEWVQAIARVIEHRVPPFRNVGLRFVRQVDAYLTRDHIRQAVDDIVRPALEGDARVVVSHSLGTIVTYALLRELGQKAHVPLLLTLGSPLGINAVKDRIKPPKLQVPDGVNRWLNGTDERDYVALYARLGGAAFADGIEDIADIHNRQEDAHYIGDYLAHPVVAKRIHAALEAG